MFGLGMGEVLIILVAALIFIGPKKLPQIAKTIGSFFREMQQAKDGFMNQLDREAMEQQWRQDASNKPPHPADPAPHDKHSPESPEQEGHLEAEYSHYDPSQDHQQDFHADNHPDDHKKSESKDNDSSGKKDS